ncbi:MAG: retropepsin-like aspartic protease [bacterium]|nr:retropepsin-like aspartic protease [bacterium]
MNKKYNIIAIFVCAALFLSGCAILKLPGQIIVVAGKIVVVTLQTTGKLITTTGKIVATVVKIPGGRKVIKLTKVGNALFANAVLNKKVKTQLVIDTGCTHTQISARIAKKLKIKKNEGEKVLCELANGQKVEGRAVNIKEIKVGKVKAYNVRVVILDREISGESDGLLGMSFLNNFIFKIDTEKSELTLEKRKKPNR